MIRGRKFHLDKANGKFMGVCAGVANLFGWDPTLVRIGLVVVTLAGGAPWTFIAYALAAWLGRPKPRSLWDDESAHLARPSTYDVKHSMRDIDRRLAEVESYVTAENSSLAREIEALR